MSIAHPSNQSNYAVERSAAQTETPHAVWRRRIIRKTPDEIAQLFVELEERQTLDLGITGKMVADACIERDELDQGCSWLADKVRLIEECWWMTGADVDNEKAYAADLNQGCADLARRAQTAEEQLFTALSLTTSDAYLLENALKRLANEERNHDTTKRLLVQLQAEADDLRNRLALVAETHVNDLAITGDVYDALSVAHTEAIDILGRVAHCLIEHIDIGPALTKQIMTIITKDTTP